MSVPDIPSTVGAEGSEPGRRGAGRLLALAHGVDALTRQRRVWLLVVVLLLGGCVSHPVGPARTSASYEAKARTTASSARSSVATARLLAETASAGKTFGGYASTSASEAEDSLSATIGTFDSIQPPNAESDALRDELDSLLQDALSRVTDVRVAARRGQFTEMGLLTAPLEESEVALTGWLAAHGAKD